MTGCGCLILIAVLVGLIVFMVFGSTDAGAPIESAVALLVLVLLAERVALVPRRRALVGSRDA